MRPTECEKCQEHFSMIIEAQTRHILATQGESAAQAFADEKLEPFHEEHDFDRNVGLGGERMDYGPQKRENR